MLNLFDSSTNSMNMSLNCTGNFSSNYTNDVDENNKSTYPYLIYTVTAFAIPLFALALQNYIKHISIGSTPDKIQND